MLHPDWTAYKYFCEVLPCRCPQQQLYNKCLRRGGYTRQRYCECDCERSEATGSK